MENHGGMISTGKILIRPPEISGNPITSSSSKVGGAGEGNYEFGFAKYFCSCLELIYYMP
jgi:hypothetical protein